MIKVNGGFPPIKYCSTVELSTTKKISNKERLYAPKTHNMNIREILKNNKVKPIIDINPETKDTLDIVD